MNLAGYFVTRGELERFRIPVDLSCHMTLYKSGQDAIYLDSRCGALSSRGACPMGISWRRACEAGSCYVAYLLLGISYISVLYLAGSLYGIIGYIAAMGVILCIWVWSRMSSSTAELSPEPPTAASRHVHTTHD